MGRFGKLTIDSTSVKANSCWPTDGKILTGLLRRANRLGQKLHVFGLEDFRKGWVGRWLQEMDKLEFQICLASGKPKSKGKPEQTLPAVAQAGPQGGRLTNGGTEPS